MSHAEKCPVCEGSGKKFRDHETPATDKNAGSWYKPCHGCGGSGWITVQDEAVYIPSVWIEPKRPYDDPWKDCTAWGS